MYHPHISWCYESSSCLLYSIFYIYLFPHYCVHHYLNLYRNLSLKFSTRQIGSLFAWITLIIFVVPLWILDIVVVTFYRLCLIYLSFHFLCGLEGNINNEVWILKLLFYRSLVMSLLNSISNVFIIHSTYSQQEQ